MPSQIAILNYVNSTGHVSRDWDRRNPPRIVGYCRESSEVLFKALFPDYSVTNFRNFDIFTDNPEHFFPMVGLGIKDYFSISPVYGLNHEVTGDLSGLRQVLERDEQFLGLKRNPETFQKEIDFILSRSSSFEDPNSFLYRRREGKESADRLSEIKDLVRAFKQ